MGHDGVAVTPGNSNNLAARGCVRDAVPMSLALACAFVWALACVCGAARAQNGEPSSTAAAPATPAGPQQAVLPGAAPVTPPPQPSAPGAAAQAPAEKHGLFDDLSHWWQDSVADFNAKLKEQQSKIDDFNKKSAEAAKDAATATGQAMKNAADAMVKSATSKVIEVHEPCAIAGNGAADCASAAANACKGKGFSDGQPLDVRTAEKCNASLWLQGQGQRSANAECPVETVVLRAACQ
jgi:hypothetical protein